MADWKLFCLGRPILEMDGKPVKLEMRKSLALLIYLRTSGHDYSRESLSTLFWPEYDQQHALSNLRRTLSSLNKHLKTKLLVADREKIGLLDPSSLWLDIESFQGLVAAVKNHKHADDQPCSECHHMLEEAIRLYRGDFLEGFNIGSCPGFDDWQTLQRENLRPLLGWVLQQLTEGYVALSDWEQAINYARRWVALDQLHEPAQQKLIRLYINSGQRSSAMQQYKEFIGLLKVELNQPPDKETLAIFEELKGRESLEKGGSSLQTYAAQKEVPILKTKLFIPISRQAIINRARLISRIDQGVKGSLTLISSPAGSGKTTILTDWAKHSPMPIAWISLDSGDNDPTRFLAYLISAMESLHEGISNGLIPMLQTLQLTPWELILSQLINQLEVITEPFVLVLDDYQFINFKLVHEMVAFLLNNLPPNFHLIIATRSEPPLPLARLRTRGQFYELRESDLRFVPEEANELFNQVMGLNLSSAEISTLENRTEGWALGLQMAGIALHSLTGSRNQFIQSFSGSHKYILDYLVDEVLGHQSQEIQSFLLQTSILDRLNSSLCDLIIEDREKERSSTSQVQLSPETTSSTLFTNSQQILEYLEQSNLFLIPLDDERRWFRYHHLFADLLLSRLRHSQPLRERILHIRAMGWYEQEGMINEAVRHAIAAKDYEKTVRLINLHALTTIANGEMHTVQSWLNALPKEEALHQPWLEIYQAWIWLILGQVEGVESMLDHVEKIIPKNTFETEDMLGNLALLRSEIVLLNGKSDQSLQLLKDAQKFLSKKSVIPRWLIPLVMGDAYLFIGDMEKASLFYEEACDLSRKIGNVFISLMSLDTLAFIYQFQGSLHEAERIFQEAIRLGTDKSGKHSILLGGPLIGYSDVFYERNDLEMARMYAEEGIKGAEQLGRANLLVHGYVALAQVLQAQGDFEKTGEAIQKAEQWIRSRKVYPLTASRLINVKLNYWMATGKLGEINGWVSAYRLKKDGNLIHPAILELIAQARKFFFQKEDRRALNLLMCLEKIVETKGLISSLVQIRLLLALILLRNGDIDESMIVFKKCITLAEPCGYMRTFIDEGSQVIRLFDEYQKRTDDGRLQADQKLTLYLEKIRHAF